jgi:hypothetical protein
MVVHIYTPSYSYIGGVRRIMSSRPVWAKSVKSCLKNKKQKMVEGIVQVVEKLPSNHKEPQKSIF